MFEFEERRRREQTWTSSDVHASIGLEEYDGRLLDGWKKNEMSKMSVKKKMKKEKEQKRKEKTIKIPIPTLRFSMPPSLSLLRKAIQK